MFSNLHHAHVRQYFESEEFFNAISVMEGSQCTIKELATEYEVFVVSAAVEFPNSFSAKFGWLKRHFPFIPSSRIVFCGDKSVIAADYLIDDNLRNLTNFRGQGILFSAHHNVGVTGFPRADNWAQVRAMFLAEAVGKETSSAIGESRFL